LADFARLRFTAIEAARTPKNPAVENARSLHDLMEDFLAVYDELDENVSMYEDRQSDLRKALKTVLLADGEFQARLEGLQHNLTPQERTECDFTLSSIVEAVTTGTVEHRKLLAEQEASFRNKKKK
jgi:molecular chaperone GrpE (heat shock protein)